MIIAQNRNVTICHNNIIFKLFSHSHYLLLIFLLNSNKIMSNLKIYDESCNNYFHWYYRGEGAFIKFPSQHSHLDTIFYVHSSITFKHLLMALNMPETAVAYPEAINPSSKVLEYLNDYSKPKAVEFLFNGKQKFLRNKACSRNSMMALSAMQKPQSIYSYLAKYVSASPEQANISAQINYFLVHFYLRLNGMVYCRLNNVNMSGMMSPKLQNDIINFMVDTYENHSPAAIKEVEEDKVQLMLKINSIKKEIEELESLCEKRFGVYKWGAITVTAVHISSFFYMIFFVDWLGWDIIEPLTYTVGVVYTLLGIRFYRKYKFDRTTEHIREVILKQVINPLKMIQLKDLKKRLAIEEAHLENLEARSRIFKNRINFRTSLCQSLASAQFV